MKILKYLALFIFTFSACKKGKKVKMIGKMKFTVENITLRRTGGDSTYKQFGAYITSLTPIKFTSNVWSIGYLDRVMVPNSNEANSLEYVNQQYCGPGCLKPENHPDRYMDFSGNTLINVTPGIGGNVDGDRNTFQADEVNFIYFYFLPYYFYQEVLLPSQYAGKTIDMFKNSGKDSAIIEGNVLKVRHTQMIKKIYPNANINQYIQFIFGHCDSTFVVNPNAELVPRGDNSPLMGDPQNSLTIRSHLYSNMVYKKPSKNTETVTLTGVLSFNTEGLIQVYAGADNIPYNSDDIFVYAPAFWERLKSKLEIQ